MSLLDCQRDSGWIGCIDFGTAFSKFAMVAVDDRENLDKNDIRPLPISVSPEFKGRNPFLLPSMLYITNDCILFGAEAETRALQTRGSIRRPFSSPKQFLSSHEPAAFDLEIEKEIDPTGKFTPRILLALFMAHLLERAGAHARALKLPWPIGVRIARPAWKSDRATRGELFLREIVVTGFALIDILGKQLSAKGGITHKKALSAFAKTAKQDLRRDGIFIESEDGSASVLEATAVAAGSLRTPGRRIVAVADIGGGTSDFGCFLTGHSDKKLVIAEIDGGSHILTRAGDYLDMQLRRVLLNKAGFLEDDPAGSAAARALLADQRQLKENLFTQKELTVEVGDEIVNITLAEFLADSKVDQFSERLRETFHETLTVAAKCASNYPGANSAFLPRIEIYLTGGGNALPMVRALSENPSLPWAYETRAPDVLSDEAPDFVAVSRQLIVAIGGAMRDLPVTRRIAVHL
jgi:molecular chaperone DnaK (HSP70)